MVRVLSSFFLTLLGLSAGSSYPCAVRREIAPCTCRLQEPKLTTIVVACEQMPSFDNIADILNNRFPPEQDISLKISFSNLDDLPKKSFKELGMSVSNLNLNFDDLSYLNESTFTGLEGVEALSLADNKLVEVPRHVLKKMPNIKTLDLGRSRISNLLKDDFSGLPTLSTLVMVGNSLSYIEANSIPSTTIRVHLGRNYIRDLNGTMRELTHLEWIFINGNQLTTLKDQLPTEAPNIRLIHASNNMIRRLPGELLNYHSIDSLFFTNNDIEALDGVLKRCRKLKRLHLTYNKISTLAEDEFSECEMMDDMELGHNQLQSLNRAFTPLKKLKILNLTYNNLEVFSINEIRGLRYLKTLDLSHNRISRITDHIGNQVELETRVEELYLQFNELRSLDGALLGIHGLQKLFLSNNQLDHIAPDDLIGLDELQFLDISFNNLVTLEDTSKTNLPRLQELIASHNKLTSIANEFHGLPGLCKADLSYNKVNYVGKELGSQSNCKGSPWTPPRYIAGFLFVTLEGNPVVCQPEYELLEAFLKVNNTLLKADTSTCPETTSTIVPETTTALLPTTTMPQSNLVTMILPNYPANQFGNSHSGQPLEPPQVMLISDDKPLPPQPPPPEVIPIPLAFSPEFLQPEPDKNENTVMEQPEAAVKVETESRAIEEPLKAPSESEIMRHPLVVVKEEGQNITLVIPMSNGVLNKDHAVDHYIQKDDEPGEKIDRPSAITKIEIVEINPLPNAPGTQLVSKENVRLPPSD